MKSFLTIMLFVSASVLTLFVSGCASSTDNAIAEQSSEQTASAFNPPMAQEATGATRKHTAERGASNTGTLTFYHDANGNLVPLLSWSQDANSDFATKGVSQATIEQGVAVPVVLNGQEFQGPFGQKITIGAIAESDADNYDEQLSAMMQGYVDRVDAVTRYVDASYRGKTLVVGERFNGWVRVINASGDQLVRVAGEVASALSPQYIMYKTGQDVVTQAVAIVTDDGGTVEGFTDPNNPNGAPPDFQD
ncbi:MAG: hypothetical protein AAFX93_19920 [Verrucomicrobiota bacterium]